MAAGARGDDARRGLLVDIDGTLVDTTYQHTLAWVEAFRQHGYDVSAAAVHRAVGMGSDRLVGHLVGRSDDAVVEAHSRFYGPHLERLRAFPGAADLLATAAAAGRQVVLATSAEPAEVTALLAAVGAPDGVVGEVTSSGDAAASKPAPDILGVALDRTGLDPGRCVFVGDTGWDVEAAARAGMPCVGVRSGGWSEAELRDAGAVAVYRDVAALRDGFGHSPLA